MAKFQLNRLVRNKVPDIIKSQGVISIIRFLDGEDYFKALKERLLSEAEEIQSPNESMVLSNIATLSEVVDAMAKYSGFNGKQIEEEKKRKVKDLGNYDMGYYIDEIETDNPIRIDYYREKKYKEII